MRNFNKRVQEKSGGSEAFVEFLRCLEAKNRRFGPLRRPHPTARSVSFRFDRCFCFVPILVCSLGKKIFASANASMFSNKDSLLGIKSLGFIFYSFFFCSF